MKAIINITKKTSFIELLLFVGVACLAITAGYASITSNKTAPYADITGSAQQIKVKPLADMQPMPAPIDRAN